MVAAYWRVARPGLKWATKVPPGPADPGWQSFWDGVYEKMIEGRAFSLEYSLRALQADIDKLRSQEGLPVRLREVEDELRSVQELSRFLVSRIPPIVIFDQDVYYHNRRGIAAHSAVVRGFHGSNIITADPDRRVDLPYDEDGFVKAWRAKSYEIVLVVPVGTRLEEDKVQASLEGW